MSKRGENIYKRKDGRFEGRYVKGYGADGKIRYGYCYGKTYRETKEKLAMSSLNRQSVPEIFPSGFRRLGVYCDRWLYLRQPAVKESTYVKYKGILDNHIKPLLGGCYVDRLDSLAVQQFSSQLTDRGLSAKTVKDILTVLRSVLNYVSQELPGCADRIQVVYPKEERKEMRVLTKEEQERLVTYLTQSDDPCRFGVMIALLTGLRIGELCALRWRDISLADGTLRVFHTLQRVKSDQGDQEKKTAVIFTQPKTVNSCRVIPLTEYARKLCLSQKTRSPENFVLTGTKQYIEPRALQYRMAGYTKACGLQGVHFHTLRHTFATRCVEVGFELKTLSEILGHSSPKITLERYVHSSLELKRKNMDKLQAIGY